MNLKKKIPPQLHAKEFQYVAVCEIVLCNVVVRSIEKFIRYYFSIIISHLDVCFSWEIVLGEFNYRSACYRKDKRQDSALAIGSKKC